MEAQHPARLSDVQGALVEGQAVRAVEPGDEDDRLVGAAAAVAVGQGHHAALPRDRQQQSAGRIHSHEACAAQPGRKNSDVEAGRHRDLRLVGGRRRREHGEAQQQRGQSDPAEPDQAADHLCVLYHS